MRRGLIPLCLLALAAPAAGADERPDPEALARELVPALAEDTLAVARLDLARLDADDFFRRVVAAAPAHTRPEVESAADAFRDFRTAFAKAGGGVVIVAFPAATLPAPGAVYVPLPDGADAEALARVLREHVRLGRETAVEKQGAMLVAAAPAELRRLRDGKPPPRPGLADAVRAAGPAAATLLVVPTDDQRRVLEEVVPTLMKEVGGGPTRVVTQGARWAAAGLDLKPDFRLAVTAQSASPEAARRLADLAAAGVGALGRLTFRGEKRTLAELFPDALAAAVAAVKPQVKDSRVVITVTDLKRVEEVLAKAGEVNAMLPGAERSRNGENLRRIAYAIHAYADAHGGRFPPQALRAKDGTPLLSWRVALLPYLGEKELYEQFKLDEPWDGEHNKKLIAKIPAVYRSPLLRDKQPGRTTYLAPVGEHLAFPPKGQLRIADFPDGTSNTILLVDAADERAVDWTRPEDLAVDLNDPRKGLLGHYPTFFLVGLADASTRAVPKTVSEATLRAAFTRDGGEVFGSDW
jgi:hypothetical protein